MLLLQNIGRPCSHRPDDHQHKESSSRASTSRRRKAHQEPLDRASENVMLILERWDTCDLRVHQELLNYQ